MNGDILQMDAYLYTLHSVQEIIDATLGWNEELATDADALVAKKNVIIEEMLSIVGRDTSTV